LLLLKLKREIKNYAIGFEEKTDILLDLLSLNLVDFAISADVKIIELMDC